MKVGARGPWLFLGIVLAWRFLVLVGTAQPVPGNDAFLFDGAVINWLLHGHYFNPSLAKCFPISGHQVFSAYPPIYQGFLVPWMVLFGTSALSAMWFHFACFASSGVVLLKILTALFPRTLPMPLATLFLFAVTFDDRPEGLAHLFGLIALLMSVLESRSALKPTVAHTGLALALFCSLYTSLVVGAFYCGVAFLAGLLGCRMTRRPLPWSVPVGVIVLFGGVTFWISKAHPLWWQGFLENARQTPVSTTGLRLPRLDEAIKILRNAPVFILALICAPALLRAAAGRERPRADGSLPAPDGGLALTIAVIVTGCALLLGALTLFTANYVVYLWYAQVLLAAGLLSWGTSLSPKLRRLLHVGLAGCLVLVSIRAVGLTTWGVLCATDVSYARAQDIVRQELNPLAASGARPVVSSAFLYETAKLGVRGAIHADWAYERRGLPPGGDLAELSRLRPPRLILTQFDFFRVYAPIIQDLQRHPELGSARVRNTAAIPAPDSFASLQRILQQVSWAPVIVEFEWKQGAG